MKKYLMSGALALIAGLFVTSCHDDDVYGNIDTIEQKTQGFQKAFKEAFGPINPNQTWGFKQTDAETTVIASNTTSTRAVFDGDWDGKHICNWDETKLDFNVPSNAVDLTKNSYTDAEKSATEFYIPETFNGEMSFYAFNIPANAKIYNLGVVTGFNANADGLIVFYNINTMTYSISSGSRHTVINTGILTVTNYANIGDVYNKGSLVLRGEPQYDYSQPWPFPITGYSTADIPNEMHIYSNGEGSVLMPDGGDLKAVCDIHGMLTVGNRDNQIVKNVKIQNSTRKYICGIDATGTVENVDGPLETAYIKADLFTFDGNPIYLLPGGHVDVTTLKVVDSGCQFYGTAGSNGLVEATNYEFGNKNDFTHTFSNNIYFKVNGGTITVNGCYAHGQPEGTYTTVEAYLANTADEYDLAADRINAGDAAGSPACGDPWTVGTGTTLPVTTYQTTYSIKDKVIETGRILCEDLGNFSNREDLDYNDVVFNAQIIQRTYEKITKTFVDGELTNTDSDIKGQKNFARIALYAAGGTLELTVAGQEVHNLFGVGVTTMVNTRDKNTDTNHSVNGANTVVRDPVEMTNPNYENERNNCTPTDDFKDDRSSSEKENDKYLFYGYDRIIDIPIRVCYEEGDVLELKSEIGDAPHKILVDIDTRWPSERCPINEAYPQFNSYVSGDVAKFWEDGGNEDNLYDKERTISTEAVGDVMETITGEGTGTLYVLWKSEEGYDISRGLYFTNTNLLVNQGIKVGDVLRFEGTKTSEDWAIFLCDGNSSRIHADQSSLNNQDYAEVTLTADMVSKLKTNNDNAAMVITGYGVSLTRVSLIKK